MPLCSLPFVYLPPIDGKRAYTVENGDVAQLARALDWQSRGRRFEPDLLHSLSEKTRKE